MRTWDSGVGVHVADLPTARLPQGAAVVFSIYWPEAAHWEGRDFEVRIATAAGVRAATPAIAPLSSVL